MTATQPQMELVAEHALPILALAENDNKYHAHQEVGFSRTYLTIQLLKMPGYPGVNASALPAR